MNHRSLRGIVAAGLFLAIASNAQICNSTVIFDGSKNNGKMEDSGRTFPEAPEWRANWGNFEKMESPYMRLSGIKNSRGDWTGTLVFDGLPADVRGGTLKMAVRATQAAKFGVWLVESAGAGNISFHNIDANRTHELAVPIENLLGKRDARVHKIGIGLFDVPANQYTTLFVDNIEFTCAGDGSESSNSQETTNGTQASAAYYFRDVDPFTAFRPHINNEFQIREAHMAIDAATRTEFKARTNKPFVLGEQDYRQIEAYRNARDLSPEKSRDGWYKSLFLVDRNRLRDSVIANPKALFVEAQNIAAANGNRTIPLLVADIDCAVRYYSDTSFSTTSLEDHHLLLAGFPTSYVKGSKVKIAYDPYFVATTRRALPSIEICIGGKCQSIEGSSVAEFEFDSAGPQPVTVNLRSGDTTTQQILSLEVK